LEFYDIARTHAKTCFTLQQDAGRNFTANARKRSPFDPSSMKSATIASAGTRGIASHTRSHLPATDNLSFPDRIANRPRERHD
jgi:hypothetical protein